MSHKLENYLRTYRKRAGFSQDEVAFLLGCRGGAKLCRYERFVRQPSLTAVLAYEAVFRVPPRELFAGLYQKVERRTLRRARLLARRVGKAEPNRMTAHKLAALSAICGTEVRDSGNSQ